jgi:hypothetical protein
LLIMNRLRTGRELASVPGLGDEGA